MTLARDGRLNPADGIPADSISSDDIRVTPAPYFRWKGIIGRLLAAVLLVPGFPAILVLVVLVRLTSRGPGIYRQVRVGRHGSLFKMYKIRTMRYDAELTSGPRWTQENDPRITRLGSVLRTLHLDELPQLINVLKGEMHLIGPRPERPEFTQVLAREIPHYLDRLAVAPGITGLAQINLPPDTDLDSVRKKLVLDLEYVCHATAALDIRMILCTFLRMCGLQGKYAMILMGVRRRVVIFDEESASTEDSTPSGHATPAALVAISNGARSNGKPHLGGGAETVAHSKSERHGVKTVDRPR